MSNLYIGLGGTGIKAAKAIYERNRSAGNSSHHERYVLIDTDIKYTTILPDALRGCFIEIGLESPSQIKARALQSPLKRWFVGWYDWYDRSFPLNEGSGAERIYGRIGLFGRYDEIYQRLSVIISQSAAELHPEESLKVFVITGSCGGTGSAIVLDVLYMINTILKSGAVPNAVRCNHVFLLVSMPEVWIEHSKPDFLQHKYISNAVAFFTELQFVIANNNTVPSPFYPAVPPKEWMKSEPFIPFQYGYAIDTRLQSSEEVGLNIAELVFRLSDEIFEFPTSVHDLTGKVLEEWLHSHKEVSNGNFSFVDWKFARKILDTDKMSDVSTEEIWDRLCKQ